MKLHYFDQTESDPDDGFLEVAKMQGYVSQECLLGGAIVMNEVKLGKDPCAGCAGPREKCSGRPREA